MMMKQAKPWKLIVSDLELNDLKERVLKSRLPDVGPGEETWDYGLPTFYAKKIQKYWLEQFDWRKQEKLINQFHHFSLQNIEEKLDIHFIHEKRQKGSKFLPILLVHGWPGSFWEFHSVIPRLLEAGFEVVVPSLPGYGFSSPPQTRGFSVVKVADVLDSLMKSLGHSQYYAQGGDWGGYICKILGSQPKKYGCVGIHVNLAFARPPPNYKPQEEDDLKRLKKSSQFNSLETGYQEIQKTKPQTLGYGLNDSPLGLACWIIEKFSSWADTKNTYDPTLAISMDDMLTNVCIYWFSKSITRQGNAILLFKALTEKEKNSSTRLYYESLPRKGEKSNRTSFMHDIATVPTCIAEFPNEIFLAPRSWMHHSFNVKRISVFSKGGHFAALEMPEELAQDIISFFTLTYDQQQSSNSISKL